MGCKLCCENNIKNEEASLSMKDNKPEIYISNNDNKNHSIFTSEELLNEKYSIHNKSPLTAKDNKENRNIFNYTQNIVNNNYIQYSSRNKPISERDNEIISSILKEKSDFASMDITPKYFSKEQNSILKNETDKVIDNSNNSKINKDYSIKKEKEIKNERKHHKHKHKHKYNKSKTHSSKNEEEGENNNKSISKEKSQSKEIKTQTEEINENNSDNDYKSNNKSNKDELIGKDPKQMKENIKSMLDEINYSKIDNILEKATPRKETTLEKLIKYFKKKSKKLSEAEKAWLIYKWITINIDYDFAGVNNKNYDVSEEATFNRGKSICAGYANLFKKIGENLDLIVEMIGGYSKGFNYEITDKFEESESHAWNAIKINEEWYFIETTWGAGYSEDHKNFIKRFTAYYFFTPPIQFVRGHFPNESKWQLLPEKYKVDQKKFMEFVDLKSNFYDLGFDSIDPDLTFNYVSNNGSFKIFFDKNEVNGDELKVNASLFYILNSKNLENKNLKLINIQEEKNSTLVKRNKNYFEVNYLLNKRGKYKLQIFGSKKDSPKYNELFTVILICKKESSSPLSFPKTYGLYDKSDIQIIQPTSGTLFNGDKINFEVKSKTLSNLYICITNNDNSNSFIEMEKQGNIFKEEDILIYGKTVKLSTKNPKENKYDTLIEYNVEINPDNKNNIIKFPKIFGGPKNRLIEPIKEKLKKGKKYNFEIKSEIIEEMAIFIGDTNHKLDKNDNIFYGKIKIEGNGNVVQVGYNKGDNQWGILYQYDIS